MTIKKSQGYGSLLIDIAFDIAIAITIRASADAIRISVDRLIVFPNAIRIFEINHIIYILLLYEYF